MTALSLHTARVRQWQVRVNRQLHYQFRNLPEDMTTAAHSYTDSVSCHPKLPVNHFCSSIHLTNNHNGATISKYSNIYEGIVRYRYNTHCQCISVTTHCQCIRVTIHCQCISVTIHCQCISVTIHNVISVTIHCQCISVTIHCQCISVTIHCQCISVANTLPVYHCDHTLSVHQCDNTHCQCISVTIHTVISVTIHCQCISVTIHCQCISVTIHCQCISVIKHDVSVSV